MLNKGKMNLFWTQIWHLTEIINILIKYFFVLNTIYLWIFSLQTKVHGKDRVAFMESLVVADIAELKDNQVRWRMGGRVLTNWAPFHFAVKFLIFVSSPSILLPSRVRWPSSPMRREASWTTSSWRRRTRATSTSSPTPAAPTRTRLTWRWTQTAVCVERWMGGAVSGTWRVCFVCHLQAKLAEFKAAGFDADLEFLDAALIALQGNMFTSVFHFFPALLFHVLIFCLHIFIYLPTLCHDLMCFFAFLSHQLLYCYLNVPGHFTLFSITSSLC